MLLSACVCNLCFPPFLHRQLVLFFAFAIPSSTNDGFCPLLGIHQQHLKTATIHLECFCSFFFCCLWHVMIIINHLLIHLLWKIIHSKYHLVIHLLQKIIHPMVHLELRLLKNMVVHHLIHPLPPRYENWIKVWFSWIFQRIW